MSDGALVIVSSAYGSQGDVAPLLALAREVRRRAPAGARVAFVTNPFYRAEVEASPGLTFAGVGSAEAHARLLADSDARRDKRALVRHWLSHLDEHRETLLRLVRAPGVTDVVLVAHPLDLAARCLEETHARHLAGKRTAGERTAGKHATNPATNPATDPSRAAPRLACFTAVLSPAMLRGGDVRHPPFGGGLVAPSRAPRWLANLTHRLNDLVVDAAFRPQLDAHRRRLGLPPASRVYNRWFLCRRALALWPEWFGPPRADWPSGVSIVGFPSLSRDRDFGPGPLPIDVEAFLARAPPPWVFVAGSGNPPGASRFFAAAVAAVAELDRQHPPAAAILLTRHPERLPPSLTSESPHLRIAHFDYADLRALLPRCAGVVHNGGVGSCAAATAAGARQIIVPAAFDQFDNARRLLKLGVARVVPAAKFTRARAKRVAKLMQIMTEEDSNRRDDVAATAAREEANGPGGVRIAAEHVLEAALCRDAVRYD